MKVLGGELAARDGEASELAATLLCEDRAVNVDEQADLNATQNEWNTQ